MSFSTLAANSSNLSRQCPRCLAPPNQSCRDSRDSSAMKTVHRERGNRHKIAYAPRKLVR